MYSKKPHIIPTIIGGDIVSSLSNVADKIGLPLKNVHLPGHNFTGPFTELDKRLDENESPLLQFKPFNQIDNIALHHDLCYRDADNTGSKTREDCDKTMLEDLDKIKIKGFREKIVIVKPNFWLKHKLGL